MEKNAEMLFHNGEQKPTSLSPDSDYKLQRRSYFELELPTTPALNLEREAVGGPLQSVMVEYRIAYAWGVNTIGGP